MDSLDHFGLRWDSGVDYQSQHIGDYEAAISQLKNRDLIYPCTCSRSQLADAQQVYPGYCRRQPASTILPHALRIKTEDISATFDDDLQGEISQNLARQHGDFIIKRKDGIIAYQLAVVIDDFRQGVNHVVRGYDLLDSTPKQLYLQQLLGYPPPHYMHVPVIVDRDGNKLSKQTRAEAVDGNRAAPTLFLLLTLLQQNPPASLRSSSVASILEWAVAHWRADHMIKTEAVPASPPSD